MPGMALQQGQPMLFEPVTWSTRDRVAYYRMDAARLRRMAETADCATARELLVDLARRYRRGAHPGGKKAPPPPLYLPPPPGRRSQKPPPGHLSSARRAFPFPLKKHSPSPIG